MVFLLENGWKWWFSIANGSISSRKSQWMPEASLCQGVYNPWPMAQSGVRVEARGRWKWGLENVGRMEPLKCVFWAAIIGLLGFHMVSVYVSLQIPILHSSSTCSTSMKHKRNHQISRISLLVDPSGCLDPSNHGGAELWSRYGYGWKSGTQ